MLRIAFSATCGPYKEPNPIKQDEIAGHSLRMLREHYRGKLRVPDVKRLFEQMREELGR